MLFLRTRLRFFETSFESNTVLPNVSNALALPRSKGVSSQATRVVKMFFSLETSKCEFIGLDDNIQ